MNEPENYAARRSLQELAKTLEGRTIKSAGVMETNSMAWVRLCLDDGRDIDIGVTGNLHDEAYLMFEAARCRVKGYEGR